MATDFTPLRMWGRFEHSLDDKFRVIVPQKFRDKLGEEFILTIGPGRHVRVYPKVVWENMEEVLTSGDARDELNKDLGFLQRMFGSCEFTGSDPQNRLTIPKHLREWAGLDEGNPAIIVGSGDRLELWSRDNWRVYSEGFTEDNAALAMSSRREPAKAPPATTENTEI